MMAALNPSKMKPLSGLLSLITMKRPAKRLHALKCLSRDVYKTLGEDRFPVAYLE